MSRTITDKQRLDWLEVRKAMVNTAEAPGWEGPHVCVDNEDGSMQHFKGITYREAIDKAMKETTS